MTQAFDLSLILALTYCACVAAVYFGQRRLQYRPTHFDAAGLGNDTFKPWVDGSGEVIGYRRDGAPARGAVLVFHGKGGEALDWSWYSHIVGADLTIALAEYPGYGPRRGDVSETDMKRAALACFDSLQEETRLPITVIGESLGSGIATFVAARRRIERLALVSPFTSALAVAKYYYPLLPISMLMKDRFESLHDIRRVEAPLHIVHGERDYVVPTRMGKQLYETHEGARKELTLIPGRGHADLRDSLLSERRAQAFRDFINGNDELTARSSSVA